MQRNKEPHPSCVTTHMKISSQMTKLSAQFRIFKQLVAIVVHICFLMNRRTGRDNGTTLCTTWSKWLMGGGSSSPITHQRPQCSGPQVIPGTAAVTRLGKPDSSHRQYSSLTATSRFWCREPIWRALRVTLLSIRSRVIRYAWITHVIWKQQATIFQSDSCEVKLLRFVCEEDMFLF